jgi:hypothetical protein
MAFRTNTMDIHIPGNADDTLDMQLLDEAGDPVDITGVTDAILTIRQKHYSVSAIWIGDMGSGNVTIDEPSGGITITFPAEDFDGVDLTKAVYDLILVDNTGYRLKLLQGCVHIEPSVGRLDD